MKSAHQARVISPTSTVPTATSEIARGGRILNASDGLQTAKLPPLRLEAKDGLSIVNVTPSIIDLSRLALVAAHKLVK